MTERRKINFQDLVDILSYDPQNKEPDHDTYDLWSPYIDVGNIRNHPRSIAMSDSTAIIYDYTAYIKVLKKNITENGLG